MQVLNGATTYPATLMSVDTCCAFDEFEQKLHWAVPEAPMFLLSALIAQCAQWDEIRSHQCLGPSEDGEDQARIAGAGTDWRQRIAPWSGG